MKLKFTINSEGKKQYTLNQEGTKDAHYKFIKIRDAPSNKNSMPQKHRKKFSKN